MRLHSLAAACALILIGTSSVSADEEGDFSARLNGFREVPPILTNGRGTFTATLDASGTSLSFTLTFSALSSAATVAHIHFAQAGVAGNIISFLCGHGSKPACPAAGGPVTGTSATADILAVPAQAITPGSLSEIRRLLGTLDT